MKSLRSLEKAFATPTALLAAAAVIATSAPLASVSTTTTQGISHEVTAASNYDVALATNVVMWNGTNVPFLSKTDIQNSLQGVLCTGVFDCEVEDYDNFFISFTPTSEKVKQFSDVTQEQTGSELVVYVGYSQGAQILNLVLMGRANGELPPGVVPEAFILMGNPSHPLNGMFKLPEFDNPHLVLNIAREYDGFADFPNNPFNLLAVANAIAGIFVVHPDYESIDIDSEDNLNYTDPNNPTKTYTLIPTKTLPLLQSLRDTLKVFGLESIVDDGLNPWLKPIVDSAYDRSMYQASTPPEEPTQDAVPATSRMTTTVEPTQVSSEPSSVPSGKRPLEHQTTQPVVSTLKQEEPSEQPEQSLPVTGNDQQVDKPEPPATESDTKVESEAVQDQPKQQEPARQQPTSSVNDDTESTPVKDDSKTASTVKQDNPKPKHRLGSKKSESDSKKPDRSSKLGNKKSSASDSKGSKRSHKDSKNSE